MDTQPATSKFTKDAARPAPESATAIAVRRRLASAIRAARERRRPRLSQRALAKLVGVSYTTIQRAESEGSDTSFALVAQIAQVLGLSLDELAYGRRATKQEAEVPPAPLVPPLEAAPIPKLEGPGAAATLDPELVRLVRTFHALGVPPKAIPMLNVGHVRFRGENLVIHVVGEKTLTFHVESAAMRAIRDAIQWAWSASLAAQVAPSDAWPLLPVQPGKTRRLSPVLVNAILLEAA